MKFSILPLLAMALPMLLVQHATPANAAALCIPGIYCPETAPAPTPQCSCTESGISTQASTKTSSVPKPTSSSTSTSHPKPITTWTPTTTVTPKPTSTWTSSTTVAPKPTTSIASGSTHTNTKTSETVYTTPKPSHSSSAGGSPTVTTTVTITGAPQPTGSSCNTGPVQCCDSVASSDSKEASNLLGLLGVVLQGTNIPVGINCLPVSIVGGGTAGSCNAQTVCCENNNFNGLINLGCSPINIAL